MLEVILTEDVPKLGHAGELVRVRDGYARNYLLPQGKAQLATRGRIKELEHQRRVIEDAQRKEILAHQATAERIAAVTLEFPMQAGEEGKLFGSVTNNDIATRLAEQGLEVERRRIELTEPIKQVGEFEVPVRLHREVIAQLKVQVVAAE